MVTKTQTPAVGYIRMSDKKQDVSPEQQRKEITKLAVREGCKIIRWYDKDLGISGDATEKRLDFQRMIRDAEEKGDFAAILCWDQDRFGRFDSIEAGRWIHPLRQAGVWLLTVGQGRIDWNTFQGRMIYGIQQEGKNQYLIDLSRNVCRGRLDAMRENRVPPPPIYGYDRVFFDQTGKQAARVPYGEKFTKPKGWTAKLSPAADAVTAETVRWMFQAVANDDYGLRSLVKELTARGIPSPRGRGWSWSAVHYILTNPAYAGMRAHGRYVGGKYYQIGDGAEVVEGNGRRQFKHRTEPLFLQHDDHPPLVDSDTFEQVQRCLNARRITKERPRDNAYLLRGVLFCGHCGGRLYGAPGGRKTENGYSLHYYVCETGTKHGASKCQKYAVRQDHLERYIMGVVTQAVSSPEATQQITDAIRQLAKTKRNGGGAELKAKIRAMDAKIQKAAENVLLADADAVPELTKVLDQWRRQRATMQARLDTLAWGNEPDQERLAEKAIAELSRLREHLEAGDPSRVRQVVRAVVSRITLWWKDKGKRRQLFRGMIEFNRNGAMPTAGR
jgi:DNA invertase Pin-like site-specific DNA recombinase